MSPAEPATEKGRAGARGSVSVSKSERAYRLLEEQIVTLELAPGALISEAELALRLGLGRTPVREALQRLAVEGLVVIMPRRGVRVAEIDLKRQMRLIEVRRPLEVLTVELAAQRAGPASRVRFAELAEKMLRTGADGDYATFLMLDSEFNSALASAADNEFAGAMLSRMSGLARRFWHCHYRKVDDLQHVSGLHADVAQAIAAGDAATAVAACTRHMNYIEQFTRAALEL